MNGRIASEKTPEGRLAAVAMSLARRMREAFLKSGQGPGEPDYADYRDALRPFVERELLLARIDEARNTHHKAISARMHELTVQLNKLNAQLPEEYRI